MAYTSINPANGKLIQSIPEHTNSEVEAALSRAHEAFLSWRLESFATRAAVVRKAADLMRERLEELSRMITIEMGKLIQAQRRNVVKRRHPVLLRRSCRKISCAGSSELWKKENESRQSANRSSSWH